MKKILVVDDSHVVTVMMKKVLVKAGYDVTVAYNGREGLERTKEVLPDIILLDNMMPVMDGYTMNHYLKREPGTKDIPVIVISADERMAPLFNVENGTQITDYMLKPVQSQTLLQRIHDILKGNFHNERTDRDGIFSGIPASADLASSMERI